jgi:hypothetical protein
MFADMEDYPSGRKDLVLKTVDDCIGILAEIRYFSGICKLMG